VALEAGIDAEAFWRLTPWQSRVAAKAGYHRLLIHAWHVAALERQQKLPPLDSLTGGTPRAPMSPDAMRSVLMGAATKA
jgi:hypothetical protein